MSLLRGAGPHSVTFDWGSDVGDVTLGVVDANGDTVVASGTATTNNADGTYTYSLANQTEVGVLTFTWTDDGTTTVKTQRVHVFGSLLFTEDEARALTITGQQTPLASTSTYPTSLIDEWHDRIARMFEQKTGRSWVERYARIEMAGNGKYGLDLSRGNSRESSGVPILAPGRGRDISEILAVTVGGTTKTTYELDGSILRSTSGTWDTPSISDPVNIVVEYQYGVADDSEANRNALRMLLAKAVPSDLAASATSWSNEDGSFSRDRFGYAFPTDVFEWLKRNPSVPFA